MTHWTQAAIPFLILLAVVVWTAAAIVTVTVAGL